MREDKRLMKLKRKKKRLVLTEKYTNLDYFCNHFKSVSMILSNI